MISRIKSGKHRRSENTEEMNNGYWKLLKTEETKVDSDEWLKLPKDKQVEHRLVAFWISYVIQPIDVKGKSSVFLM